MKKIAIALFAAGLSTAAFAQVAALDLTVLDTDKSGDVSFAEVQVALPELTEELFKTADIDASGTLSAEELVTLTPPAQ
jgi:EF hand